MPDDAVTEREHYECASGRSNLVDFAPPLIKIIVGGLSSMEQKLSDREIEVLKWAAHGKTSSEISEIMVISVSTVNFHVKNAIQKLKTANKTAAAVRASMLGLLN